MSARFFGHIGRFVGLVLVIGMTFGLLSGCAFIRFLFFGEICKASWASISVFPSLGPPPLTVELEGDPGCGRIGLCYDWHLGDGATASGERIRHTYTEPGQYHITMDVQFVGGTDSDDAFVAVTDRVNFNTRFPLEDWPIAVADFTGEGYLDFVGPPQRTAQDELLLYLYRGHGDGTFTKGLAFSTHWIIGISGPCGVADFNGDGWLDILPFDTIHGGHLSQIFVLLNRGDGTFEQSPSWTFGESAYIEELAVGDFDGDRSKDLVFLTLGSGEQDLFIIWGRGDGTFSQPLNLLNRSREENAGIAPLGHPLAGDLDGDGIDDLLVAESRYHQGWSHGPTWSGMLLFPGRQDRFLRQTEPLEMDLSVAISGMLATDLNGDGQEDLAIAQLQLPETNTILDIYYNCGGGRLQRGKRYIVLKGRNPYYQPKTGDFDGDGWPDLLLAGGPAAIAFNEGEGFSPPVIFSPGAGEVGDFNCDGYDDLINYKTLLLNFGPFSRGE